MTSRLVTRPSSYYQRIENVFPGTLQPLTLFIKFHQQKTYITVSFLVEFC